MVRTFRPFYSHEETGIHCPGGWMILGASLYVTERLASKGIRSPNRPARSESLYQLRYPGRHVRI